MDISKLIEKLKTKYQNTGFSRGAEYAATVFSADANSRVWFAPACDATSADRFKIFRSLAATQRGVEWLSKSQGCDLLSKFSVA